MALKKCKECGSEISSSAKTCPNCGKKQGSDWVPLAIIIIFLFCILVGFVNGNETNQSINENLKERQIQSVEVYNKNDIIIQILNYEYDKLGNLQVNMLIENNSKKDLDFTIDGDATLNEYTVNTYFYETVNKETKKNCSFKLKLDDNKIKEDSLSILKFKLDIYYGDNYIIEERIEDNLEIKYEF